jgi:xylan 1,4-beta-xylosidase
MMSQRHEVRLGSALRAAVVLTLVGGIPQLAAQGARQAIPDAVVRVDLNQRVGEMYPIWGFIGYDEANYTYLPDGRDLLSEYAALTPGPVWVRAHNLLNTHDGDPVALKWGSTNVYTEDAQGNPVYDWTMMDRIVDTWVERGMKPLMEIGFMPRALTTGPDPYRHHWLPGQPYSDIQTGWRYPPNDYDKWEELIYRWVRHSVERYGAAEVESWWWQLWNEADHVNYWTGTDEEFFKLYDYTAHAVKRALPTARIGGPNTTGAFSPRQAQFFRDFLAHVTGGTNYVTGQRGSPIDVIGFHAKGAPIVTDEGHVRMRMSFQLRQIDAAFNIIHSFPQLRNVPVIIGESDPEGCAACGLQFGYPQMGYRNGTMFSSYTASSFAKKYELADRYGTNFEGAVSWTFTFPNFPYFSGFRSFTTTDGISKPVLNVMRMFGMMGGDRVRVTNGEDPYSAQRVIDQGVVDEPDIGGIASRDGDVASVMVWNYHDDDLPAAPARVQVSVANVPAQRALVRHYRIDDQHSNAYARWLDMGAPQQLSRSQIQALRDAGQLQALTSPRWVDTEAGVANLEFELPRQGVSLIQLSW